MASYLAGIDRIIHPEDEMLLNAITGLQNEGLAKAVYFRQGYEINTTLQSILDWHCSTGRDKATCKVLDFACGFGRATRFLVAEVNPANVWASDIYKDAVSFQKKQFGVNGFESCHDPSQLTCSERFDLIFVASLFTHLPQQRFEQWLERLFNMLSPDGILAFSVHDEALASGQKLPKNGFLFVKASESRSLNLEEYGATYVTEGYVAKAIQRVIKAGWNYKRLPLALCGSHDIYLISRNPTQDFSSFSHTQPPVGYVDWFTLSSDGILRIGGWAGEHDPAQAIADISISIDQQIIAHLTPDMERADVAKALNKNHFIQSGWDYSMAGIDLENQADDVIEVILTSTTGKTSILHSSTISAASRPIIETVQHDEDVPESVQPETEAAPSADVIPKAPVTPRRRILSRLVAAFKS